MRDIPSNAHHNNTLVNLATHYKSRDRIQGLSEMLVLRVKYVTSFRRRAASFTLFCSLLLGYSMNVTAAPFPLYMTHTHEFDIQVDIR